MRFGVVVFPGTWSDTDCHFVINDILLEDVEYVWHDQTALGDYGCIILPGGFSYGDYLRPGSIACLSPVMTAIRSYADNGGLVIGICNGFQILCESGLLPGVLLPNAHTEYRCVGTNLLTSRIDTPFSMLCNANQVLRIPVSHGEGNYFADPDTLANLEETGRVLFRYCGPTGEVNSDYNPNGSANNIAGILNESGNILGMMPHPERSCESLLGSTDGLLIFKSLVNSKLIK
ncbi:MAG: phosphoribosylformylglycinamidine synthase subunit PurQ [Chloroflexota bacterium]|nr:phosphoribosylformylglycinamidine synthase subunit PurQ [Chloroflexota bacterium]